jgi:hypothetical protein
MCLKQITTQVRQGSLHCEKGSKQSPDDSSILRYDTVPLLKQLSLFERILMPRYSLCQKTNWRTSYLASEFSWTLLSCKKAIESSPVDFGCAWLTKQAAKQKHQHHPIRPIKCDSGEMQPHPHGECVLATRRISFRSECPQNYGDERNRRYWKTWFGSTTSG